MSRPRSDARQDRELLQQDCYEKAFNRHSPARGADTASDGAAGGRLSVDVTQEWSRAKNHSGAPFARRASSTSGSRRFRQRSRRFHKFAINPNADGNSPPRAMAVLGLGCVKNQESSRRRKTSMNFRGLRLIRRRKFAKNESESGLFRPNLNWAWRFHGQGHERSCAAIPRPSSAPPQILDPTGPRSLCESLADRAKKPRLA
jgi:hypothetical protein